MIFHHTDYKSHDPITNPNYHSYLCIKLEAGTMLRVRFNNEPENVYEGTLEYTVFTNNDIYPHLMHESGRVEPILARDIVELI